MNLESISGMTAELDAELESLDCEYGLSAENGDETELDVSVDPSSNTSGNEDQEANLDKSIEDENEIQAIDIFYGSACCSLGPKKAACWTQFHRKSVITARRESLELTRSELDLVILANIQAGRGSPALFPDSGSSTSSRTAIHYTFGGKQICRTSFCFLYAVGHTRLENLIKHYKTQGLTSRVQKLSQSRPHNHTSFTVIERIKSFIERFADNHALPLPGRLPSHKDYRVMLLPTDMTKVFVFQQYIKTCEKESCEDGKVSRWTFQRILNDVCPYVSVMKPATDLCFDCQQNPTILMRSTNLPESVKSKRLEDAQRHLSLAKLQRHHYNDQCELAKLSLERVNDSSTVTPEYMHYSFDFAQQVHFPYSPQQPGQLFSRTPSLFGVCCEATTSQVNYLIDESDMAGKGANTIISLVHDYLEKHGKGEKHLLLHADNCVGQNKNNAFMQYLAWRVITKRNYSVQVSFMLVGHTKFAPDRFFGLFKRQFRRATVDTMYDIIRVMKESTIAGKNIPIPTVDPIGARNCQWYDWTSFLGNYFRAIPGITQYHHFQASREFPGEIVCRKFANSDDVKFQLLKKGINVSSFSSSDLPPIVTPKGLDAQRQWYLYEQIRPFCHSNLAKDITCPKPTVSKPCGGEKPTGVTSSTLSRKRKQGESSAASQPAPKRKQKLPKSK